MLIINVVFFFAPFNIQLNDVSQGGATVFIKANVAVRPKKGTAVFWYNLLPSGEGDFSTIHSACPVLTGAKSGMYLWKTKTLNNNYLLYNKKKSIF